MLTSLTHRCMQNASKQMPKMLTAYFSNKAAEVAATSEKWPPYNVCSLPFNIKPNSEHIKLKEPHKRANSLIRQLSIEAAQKAQKTMDFDDFKPGDAIEVKMKKRDGSKTEEVYRGVCVAKHNDYYNSTFTMRCNIAGEAVTILYSTYEPDIKSVHLIQESFLYKAERLTHKSKLYFLKNRPLLDVTIPPNWVPERKYVDKDKNNAWLVKRGKKPLDK